MTDFTGRRAVVMGGSRGIGRSIALGFAKAGAAVAICARGPDALEATRREIEAAGVSVYAAPCDLADKAAIARFIPEAAAASATRLQFSAIANSPNFSSRLPMACSSICHRRSFFANG